MATSAASWSRPTATEQWRELGVDVGFVQDNHSRSQRNTLRGLHFQLRPGQAKLVRCATRADLGRRRRPAPRLSRRTGAGKATSSTTSATASSTCRSGSRTASASSPTRPTSPIASRASSTPRPRPAIAWDDPELGIDWPVDEPVLSERDRAAAAVAEIADAAALLRPARRGYSTVRGPSMPASRWASTEQ